MNKLFIATSGIAEELSHDTIDHVMSLVRYEFDKPDSVDLLILEPLESGALIREHGFTKGNMFRDLHLGRCNLNIPRNIWAKREKLNDIQHSVTIMFPEEY